MLRPYTFKYNKIHKIQSFVNHVILDVLCKAPNLKAKTFTPNLVFAQYRDLIKKVNKVYILNPLKKSFEICKTLEKKELKVLKKAVIQNNRIRELCNGEIDPVLYSDIEKINKELYKHLKYFCDYLYDNCIDLAPFHNKFGKISEYYKSIVGRSSTCFVCGIHTILNQFHSHRSAFDHYLPKKFYPFNSVNFHNLMPLCDICNGKYKLGQNTLFKIKNRGKKNQQILRRKAFYPFSRNIPDINVELTFKKKYNPNIEPNDLEINIQCVGFDEEIETWDRLFGIKETFVAFCCSEDMYGVYVEYYNAAMQGFDYLDLLRLNNRYINRNFLKISFLEGVI